MRARQRGKWKGYLQRTRERAQQIKWDTLALYLAYRDPRTPMKAKMVIGLTVGYALSPIDLIPDFIPLLGYLDDLLLVPLGIGCAVRLVPKQVMEECRRRAEVEFRKGSPRSWKAAAVVLLIWIGLLALLIYLLLGLFF